jgi:bacillithiol biosynthesis deacetylase BshB1
MIKLRENMDLDVLVFGAHPDDAEIGMGGTIALLTANGLKVGVIDLTRGEMGTRGDAKTRKRESDAASRILKLSIRENLELPDGRLEVVDEYIKMIIWQIRKYKPKIVFAPYLNDRHPDHIATSKLVKTAVFHSGVAKYDTSDENEKQDPHRPDRLYYYMQAFKFEPKFIIDITKYFEKKMKSIFAYKTQFYNPKSKEPDTFISDPKFVRYLESRSAFYGFQIGKEYGEPFYTEDEVEINIVDILKKDKK